MNHYEIRPSVRFALEGLGMVALVTIATLGLSRCKSAGEAEANTAYAADLQKCVADGASREAVDACRAAVRAKWGVNDAGKVGAE